MRARLVCELAADGIPVAVACRVLNLSRAAYYDHLSKSPSAREEPDAVLTATITEVHARSRGLTGRRGSTPTSASAWASGAGAGGSRG